jgi:hypothetical protein
VTKITRESLPRRINTSGDIPEEVRRRSALARTFVPDDPGTVTRTSFDEQSTARENDAARGDVPPWLRSTVRHSATP